LEHSCEKSVNPDVCRKMGKGGGLTSKTKGKQKKRGRTKKENFIKKRENPKLMELKKKVRGVGKGLVYMEKKGGKKGGGGH